MDRREYIKNELKKYSDYEVLVYIGDVGIGASINSEYTLDSNEFIITDGAVITSINKVCYGNKRGICKTTAIRGGTYLIIGDYQEDNLKISIRADENKMTNEKISEIISKVKQFKEDDDIEYYINDYNTVGVYKTSEILIDELI